MYFFALVEEDGEEHANSQCAQCLEEGINPTALVEQGKPAYHRAPVYCILYSEFNLNNFSIPMQQFVCSADPQFKHMEPMYTSHLGKFNRLFFSSVQTDQL